MRRDPRRNAPRAALALAAPFLLALATLAPSGCAPGGEVRGPVPPPPADTGHPEFSDAPELLRAIERGTFAERAGIDLSAAVAPPPPTTVRFEKGTELPREAVPELRELSERLVGEPRWEVSVVGCSDPSGPADANRRISRERAVSVAEALREQGLADERIVRIVGRGEECDVPERAVHVSASAGEGASPGPG